jgi:serine/threonine-protein kinase RsbW
VAGPGRLDGGFDLRLPMDVAALPRMRAQLRVLLERVGLCEELVEDVVLCAQEACKNAMRHSRGADGVLVRLTMQDGGICIVVRDYGVGMAAGALAIAPAPLAESGRGLLIIRRLMDEIDVRVQDGTELRMVKRLSRPVEDADASITACA